MLDAIMNHAKAEIMQKIRCTEANNIADAVNERMSRAQADLHGRIAQLEEEKVAFEKEKQAFANEREVFEKRQETLERERRELRHLLQVMCQHYVGFNYACRTLIK